MSTPLEFPTEVQHVSERSLVETRPFYWSVRRELWENRSIYVAPLIVAVIAIFGFSVTAFRLPERRRALLLLDPATQRARIAQPYDIVAMMFIAAAFLVGIFYCLDALYGERRDRSILFWKSLPVSDRTAVFAKVSIPLLVLPAITFVLVVITQFLMMIVSTIALLPSGLAGTTWTRFNLFHQSFIFFYGLIVIALWHAPIYAWLLMVSAWARRTVILWALGPMFAVMIIEKLAFNTVRFGHFLQYRLGGGFARAFVLPPKTAMGAIPPLTPLRFLATPGLWTGLILAALFLAAAVRFRRNREPI
ncbi:MAG: ABC transporter permease [Acidobacteriota bacterium]|nr:ABC transporter permease [Acidobacteriota bacterium]